MGAAVRVVGAAVRDNPSRTMPRRPPRPGALQAAQHFARLVIAEAETDDWILPKNGTSVPEVHASADAQRCCSECVRSFIRGCLTEIVLTICGCTPAGPFSPFHGFTKMFCYHADIRNGGTSVDGISRAALNKIVGLHFSQGMRKTASFCNLVETTPVARRHMARHFLRVRWRNPDDPADMRALEPLFEELSPSQVMLCISVLREFQQSRSSIAGHSIDGDNSASQYVGAHVVPATSYDHAASRHDDHSRPLMTMHMEPQLAPPTNIAMYLTPDAGTFSGRGRSYDSLAPIGALGAHSDQQIPSASTSEESVEWHDVPPEILIQGSHPFPGAHVLNEVICSRDMEVGSSGIWRNHGMNRHDSTAPQDQPQHHAYPDQKYFARYQAFSGQQPNFDSSHAAARSTRVGSGLCASGGTSSTSAAGCDWSFPTAGPVSGEILNPNTLSLTTSGRVVPTLSCMEDSNIQQRKACGERQDNLYYPLHRVDQQAPSDCWQFD